jgi:hypothetical protein
MIPQSRRYAERTLIAPTFIGTKSNAIIVRPNDQIELVRPNPGQAAEIGPFSD